MLRRQPISPHFISTTITCLIICVQALPGQPPVNIENNQNGYVVTSARSAPDVTQKPPQLSPESFTNATADAESLAAFSGPEFGFGDAAILDRHEELVLPLHRSNVVKLWDTVSGEETGTLLAGEGLIFRSILSASSNMLALGMNNGTAELWNIKSRTRTKVLTGHTEKIVNQLAFSPDGRLLATGGMDRMLFLHSTMLDEEPRLLTDSTGQLIDLAFNHDGTVLAAPTFQGEITLWDPATGEQSGEFGLDCDRLYSFAFLRKDKHFATGDSEGVLTIWDVNADDAIAGAKAHEGIVFTVATSDDGRFLATGGKDQVIKIWDASDLREIATLKGHTEAVTFVRFSRDGKLLISRGGGSKNEVRLWRLPSE